jgi:hypothetical protein
MQKKTNDIRFNYEVSEFYRQEHNGKIAIKPRIKTLQQLASYLMRDFLEANNIKYGMAGKVEMIDYILSKQKTGHYTRENSLENISMLIMSCYVLFKKQGELPLNTKETKQLQFMFKKDLEVAIEYQKQREIEGSPLPD